MSELPQSRRMLDVQTPIIPVVAELIRRHPGTISLGQGVVHYGPPAAAGESVTRFLADPQNHKYKAVEGIPELQAAIEQKLATENGLTLAPGQKIVVTAGGNMAFFNAVLAIADPGDEIILQTPYYFNHEMALAMLNVRPVLVSTDSEYQLDLPAIRAAITPKTRAMVTISPNNPSGAVYREADLRAVNELCRERGIYHISDEAYEYFTYAPARHFSPGSIPGSSDYTMSLYSLSKAYGFASWRIGYMTIPEQLIVSVRKAQDTILICPPVISQFAACGALAAGSAFWKPKVENLAHVRELVLHELDTIRSFATIPPADGAFYFLITLDTPLTAMQVVERLVSEFGVAVIPGTTFGIEKGRTLRVAYGALDEQTVAAGIGRFVRGVQQIVKG
jgi:aspartate/methionine/tyrosine aminotransferase